MMSNGATRMFHSLHRHVNGAGSQRKRDVRGGSIGRGIREESRTAAGDSFLARRDPLFSTELSVCRIPRLILIPVSRRWVCRRNDGRSWCVFFYSASADVSPLARRDASRDGVVYLIFLALPPAFPSSYAGCKIVPSRRSQRVGEKGGKKEQRDWKTSATSPSPILLSGNILSRS